MTRRAEADLKRLLAIARDMSCEGFNQLVKKLSRASFRGLEKHICNRQVRRGSSDKPLASVPWSVPRRLVGRSALVALVWRHCPIIGLDRQPRPPRSACHDWPRLSMNVRHQDASFSAGAILNIRCPLLSTASTPQIITLLCSSFLQFTTLQVHFILLSHAVVLFCGYHKAAANW
jgi:hypothetical protein